MKYFTRNKKNIRSFTTSKKLMAFFAATTAIATANSAYAQDTTIPAPVCGVPSGLTYTGFSASTITPAAALQTDYRLSNVGVMGGVAVDLLIQFDAPPTNGPGNTPTVAGDDFLYSSGAVRTVVYTVVDAGTTTPRAGNFRLRFQDVDFNEAVSFPASDVDLVILNNPTNLTRSVSAGNITFSALAGARVNAPEDTLELVMLNRSTWTLTTTNGNNASFHRIDFNLGAPLTDIACAGDLQTIKTLSSSDSQPAVGDAISYQIQVNNNGPVLINNVQLTDVIPSGLTFTGATPGSTATGNTTYDSASGIWSIGTLGNGESVTLTINGTVNNDQGGQVITNTVTSVTADSFSDTNASVDDLTEVITIDNVLVATNDDFSSTLAASTGATTSSIFANDTINAATFAQSAVTPTITNNDGLTGLVLNADGTFTVPNGSTPGTYNVQYQLCDAGDATICSNAIAIITVAPTADLVLTLTNTPGVNAEVDQSSDTVTFGNVTTYTLTVTNNGPDAITGAVATAVITSGLTCNAADNITITGSGVPSGSFTIGDLTGAGVTLGTLNNGDSTVITYNCTVS